MLPAAFYAADGDRFASSGLTRGPWDPGQQHAGPPAALLARAVERAGAIRPGQVVRLSFDILRPVPIAPLTVAARVVRPGRRVEQIEATLVDDTGAAVMRAACWRMRAEAVPLPPGLAETEAPPSAPGEGAVRPIDFWRDEVAYHRALDWRFVDGEFDRPGPATCWTRLNAEVVAGEPPTPLERLVTMADAASGISAVLPWTTWQFVNVDLGIHLERPPEGEWMAMAARTRLGDAGAGQCTAVLYDARGRVGTSTHSLLISPRTPAP